MNRAYIWDIDGVLIWHHPVDPEKDWRSLLLGKDWLSNWEAFQRSDLWMDCLTDPAAEVCRKFRSFIQQRGGNADDADEIVGIWMKNNTQVNKSAYECLLEMRGRGYSCAIASNQDFRRAGFLTSWFEKGGMETLQYFISCDLGVAKPDTEFYRKIETALGIGGDSLVLLDDRLENLKAVQKMGWRTHHITADFDWSNFREGVLNGLF